MNMPWFQIIISLFILGLMFGYMYFVRNTPIGW